VDLNEVEIEHHDKNSQFQGFGNLNRQKMIFQMSKFASDEIGSVQDLNFKIVSDEIGKIPHLNFKLYANKEK
jgi:hypothetical protein